LTFTGTGTYPLQVAYSDGSGIPATLTIIDQQPVTLQVTPLSTSVYSLVAVTDGTNPVCSSTPASQVTLTINQPVHAGTANAPLHMCAGTSLPVQLSNLIVGADFGGQWTETSAVHSLPGGFNATTGTFLTGGQPAGTYTFKYSLKGASPCPDDQATVSVILDPLPVADAGPDKAINCNQLAVGLGGSNTSTGVGVVYNWTQNGQTVGNTAQIFTGTSGDFVLAVTTAAGCTDSDLVHVILDNEVPKANLIKIDSVRCFGEKNGKIVADSIVSKHLPVLFSLNGGPFTTQSTFYPLKPGKYSLTLQDANGCEWTYDSLQVSEPPQLLVNLGTNLEAALGDSVYLNALVTVPFAAIQSVLWNPVTDPVHADTLIQHFLPYESTPIGIKVTDKAGCVANGNILVLVSKARHVYIPNIIRPGSNVNDQLLVYGGKDVDEVKVFQIYDRWGDKMFEVQHFKPGDVDKGWNGRYKGQEAAPGVYVYYALVRFINGEEIVFKGDVTILR
jgi:hypothetical protein